MGEPGPPSARAEVEDLDEKPEAQDDAGRDRHDVDIEDQEDEGHDAGPGEEHPIRAQHSGDGPAGPVIGTREPGIFF